MRRPATSTRFDLGGLLARIHREKWFVGAGHADFRSYVEQRHGFKLRKALYLVSIYESVIDLGLTWNELKPVGWSKLKELVGVITQDNASQWLATAAAEDMTVLKLHALVRETKGEAKGEGLNGVSPLLNPRSQPSAITDAQFKAHMAAIGWEATLAVFEQTFPTSLSPSKKADLQKFGAQDLAFRRLGSDDRRRGFQ